MKKKIILFLFFYTAVACFAQNKKELIVYSHIDTLSKIYWKSGTNIIDTILNNNVDSLIRVLTCNPNQQIIIQVNETIPVTESYYLALNRANSIKEYFVIKGINADRIMTKGMIKLIEEKNFITTNSVIKIIFLK